MNTIDIFKYRDISPGMEEMIGQVMRREAKRIRQPKMAKPATNVGTSKRVKLRRASVLKMLKRGERRYDIAQALEVSSQVIDQDVSWLAAEGSLDPDTRKASCRGRW